MAISLIYTCSKLFNVFLITVISIVKTIIVINKVIIASDHIMEMVIPKKKFLFFF